MDIHWLGHSCFRLRGRDATVLIDPYPGSVGGQALARQSADILCLTNPHPNHAHRTIVEGAPPVLTGPGEYEIKGVLITGLGTTRRASEGTLPNTAYLIEMDDVGVCHLGDLSRAMTNDLKEQLGSVDVLLIPTGGHCTIDAAAAAETISLIEPRIVIPMHFGSTASDPPLDGLERFLKEMGVSEVQPQPRLSVSKSGLPEPTQVVVLEARR
ncbi:MAG TPA: MBL fold metallo-hydrolase [Dehalococcoidia bacterium]|nr:MBL fold metallo-hydrolase [Dehalococcoidia bacterium]